MTKEIKALLEENERLKAENATLQQQLQEAKVAYALFRSGNIDALVNTSKQDIKVYTGKTADKTYRILVEAMHEGAITLNKEGIILYCNSYFAKMINHPMQKVLGSQLRNYIDEESLKNFDEIFIQGWEKYVQAELCLCAKTNKCFPVLMSVNNLLLDNNSVLSIIITDLSIHFKNQEEIKHKTEQLEHKNIELEGVNKELAFQNIEKEKRSAELVLANKKLAWESLKKEKKAAELILTNKELAFQIKEKEKRAAELALATSELKLAEEQFRMVVESSPNAMILINEHGLIMLVNRQTEKLFGYNRRELLGNKLEMLLPVRYRESHLHQRTDFFKKPVSREMGEGRELYGLNKYGTEIQVEIGLNPIKTPYGTMVLATVIDITARKLFETSLLNHNKELAFQNEEKEKRADELTTAYKELKLAEEYQEEYIHGLEEMMFVTSHKLRVPITNILGISEVLDQLLNSPDKLKKMVDYIKQSAIILDDFTKELSVTMETLELKGRR